MFQPLAFGNFITFGGYNQHIFMHMHQPLVHIDIIFCWRMTQIHQLNDTAQVFPFGEIRIDKFGPFIFFRLAHLSKPIARQVNKIKHIVVDFVVVQCLRFARLAAGTRQIFAVDKFVNHRGLAHIGTPCQCNFRQIVGRILLWTYRTNYKLCIFDNQCLHLHQSQL